MAQIDSGEKQWESHECGNALEQNALRRMRVRDKEVLPLLIARATQHYWIFLRS